MDFVFEKLGSRNKPFSFFSRESYTVGSPPLHERRAQVPFLRITFEKITRIEKEYSLENRHHHYHCIFYGIMN